MERSENCFGSPGNASWYRLEDIRATDVVETGRISLPKANEMFTISVRALGPGVAIGIATAEYERAALENGDTEVWTRMIVRLRDE